MKNRIFKVMFIFFIICFFCNTFVQASMIDNTISSGKDFFDMGKEYYMNDSTSALGWQIDRLLFQGGAGLFSLVSDIAQFAIFVVALLLGLKYIFSGIEGKTIVKETLPSFVIAVIFIYLPNRLINFFQGTFGSTIHSFSTFDEIKSFIWTNISYIVQILCLVGIIFLGLKYMWSSGEKKGEYKNQAVMVILGLILVLCAEPIIRFIANVAHSFL